MKRDLPDQIRHREVARPSFAEAFRFWLKLGFISFGGPTGQIAIMQSELVEKKDGVRLTSNDSSSLQEAGLADPWSRAICITATCIILWLLPIVCIGVWRDMILVPHVLN